MKTKLRRLWLQMTVDKKKFGLMVFVMAIGLLLWGRLILIEKVPRIATADPAASDTTPAEGDNTGALSSSLLRPLPVVYADLDDRLELDLFAFRHNRYKPLPPKNNNGVGVQPGDVNVDEVVRRRELEEMAKELSLQSVIQGARPIGVINGKVLRVGDSIDGFEIVTLGTRSATVTREGQTFILTIGPQ